MNVLKNKFFLLGNLAFLLLVIPVVLFIIRNQTSTIGSASPTSTLSFNPPSLAIDQCTQTQTSTVVLTPAQNIVGTVQLALKWDKTKFEVDFAPNTAAFSQILDGPTQTADGLTVTLNIGSDVSKAITSQTNVGTLTIKPIAPTNGSVINLEVLRSGTQIKSFSEQDGVVEDVYNPAGSSPLQISITPKNCASPSTSPSPSPSPSTTVTLPPTTISPSPSVTQAPNQAPLCVNLNTSTSSGSAPLAVTFTATGRDPNGTITKATFNFGDSSQQDVTTGMGIASVSAQLAHTYNSGGNFNATVVFTDNTGAVSATCSKAIAVTGAFATTAPTIPPTATLAPIVTVAPTATPTITPPGGIGQTIGIIGGMVLIIATGIFLFVL